jgi:hypothetical protein
LAQGKIGGDGDYHAVIYDVLGFIYLLVKRVSAVADNQGGDLFRANLPIII